MLNYVKDYENNTVITVDKNKDPNREVQGIATLQLFNEHGKLIKEGRSENIISSKAIAEAFYFAMLNKSAVDSTCFPISNLGQIFLTDYTGAEDPKNTEILGNVVGFANAKTPFASLNPLQGKVDTANCFVNIAKKQIYFSFDFPGDKANGTFQSVFWTGGREVEDDNNNSQNGLAFNPKICELYDKTPLPVGAPLMCNDKGDIYAIDSNNIYKYKLYQTGQKKTLYLVSTTAKEVYAPVDGCFNPVTGTFWVVNNLTKTWKEYDRDFKLITNVTRPWMTNLNYLTNDHFNKFCFHKLSAYGTSSQTNYVYKYSYDGTYIKTYANLIDASFKAFRGIWSDQKYVYIYYYDTYSKIFCETYKEDPVTGDLVRVCRNATSMTFSTSGDYKAYLYDNPVSGYTMCSRGYFMKSFNIVGAQTLLPAPILKASGQYMRFGYMFQFK